MVSPQSGHAWVVQLQMKLLVRILLLGIPEKGEIHPKFKTSWEDKVPRASRAEG